MSDLDAKSCLPCGLHTPKRTVYFDGKLLLDRDFIAEQDYHRGLRQMHNAYLHGSGAVCGLRLVQHPAVNCQRDNLKLEPGLAIDFCGRELIVTEARLVPLKALIDDDKDLAERLDGSRHLMIGLRRCDTGTDPEPLILPDCGPGGQSRISRIREDVEIVLWTVVPEDAPSAAVEAQPSLDWVHSLSWGHETPMNTWLNDAERWLQITVQNPGGSGRVQLYDMTNRDLRAILEGVKTIGDTASAREARLLFASGQGIEAKVDTAKFGTAVWRASEAESDPAPAGVIAADEGLLRIAVGPFTGELFVLTALPGAKATLAAFSAEAIEEWLANGPVPGSQPKELARAIFPHDFGPADGPTGRGAAMMKVSPDGRFLALASPSEKPQEGLYLIDISAFHAGTLTDGGGEIRAEARPKGYKPVDDTHLVAVDFGRDGEILYVLTETKDSGAAINRYALTGASNKLQKAGRGGVLAARPFDLAVGPTEAFGFLLVADADKRTHFTSFPIEDAKLGIKPPGADPVALALSSDAIRMDGAPRGFVLQSTGKRAYVTLADADPANRPDRGVVAVVDITQADCAVCLTKGLAGCEACSDTGEENHAVILGHLPNYSLADAPRILDLSDGSDTVAIDNLSHRVILPSVAALRDTVMCILSQGVNEGPPGPRGELGKDGTDGQPGRNGQDGQPGKDGKDGKDGVNGQKGQDGQPGRDGASFELNPIIGLSWIDNADHPMADAGNFGKFLSETGVAVAWETPVDLRSWARRNGCPLVAELQQRRASALSAWEVVGTVRLRALVNPQIDPAGVITDFTSDPVMPALAKAIGLVLIADKRFELLDFKEADALRVVLHADRLVDVMGRPMDGHFVAGQLPTGKATPGGAFTSWFTLKR